MGPPYRGEVRDHQGPSPAGPALRDPARGRLAHPGVRFPPPLLFVLGFAAGWALDRVRPLALGPGAHDGSPWTDPAGLTAVALGLGVMGWALLTFRRARTAVYPNRPATRLVTGGPYRRSRNPMYVGLTAVYLGLALLAGTRWPVLLLPAVLLALTAGVIRREERYLASAFGPAYAEYCRRVRRWL